MADRLEADLAADAEQLDVVERGLGGATQDLLRKQVAYCFGKGVADRRSARPVR